VQHAWPVQTEYLRISNEFASIDAVLYSPPGNKRRTALVYTHPFASGNLSGPFCQSLAERGFAVLCFNNRYTNNQQLNTIWEPIALDMAAAIKELRDRRYQRIVLIGYSAGGPTMGYYQNLAENGNAIFRDGATLSGFKGFFTETGAERRVPRADGILLVNPSTGVGASGILRLDGAVIDEETGARDAALDMYNPANGYNPADGSAKYTAEFLAVYRAAQCARMNRLIDAAQARLALVAAGQGRFIDDEITVNIGLRANPAYADLSLAKSTKEPWPVLPENKAHIVNNDRRIANNRNANRSTPETARSDRSFLGYRGVRCLALDADATTAAEHGLDVNSNNNTLYNNIAGITVPLLILQGTADNTIVHLTLAELIHNSATRTSDRTLMYVRGMTHGLVPLTAEFGDTVDVLNDAVVDWLNTRYR
jgi:pimeloyl-ACP methyl ester carboxylesterase